MTHTKTHPAHSDTVTREVRVVAAAQYVPDRSDPDRAQYLYMYRITLRNEGSDTVKLLARRWIILDAFGNKQEVEGAGVVGQYPELAPGEEFEYMSRCPLRTEWGTMEGSYEMQTPTGERFQAEIGRFFLAPGNPPL